MEETYIPIIVALIMSIPGILALIFQRRKNFEEAKKLETESEKEKTNIAGIVQDVYQDLLTDLKKQADGCKEEITKISGKVNTIMDQNDVLTEQNHKLTEINENLLSEIKSLKNGIRLLTDQIKKLGYEPAFTIKGDK